MPDHNPRDFETKDVGNPLGRRIEPSPLEDIGPVDPRGSYRDLHFTRPRLRLLNL